MLTIQTQTQRPGRRTGEDILADNTVKLTQRNQLPSLKAEASLHRTCPEAQKGSESQHSWPPQADGEAPVWILSRVSATRFAPMKASYNRGAIGIGRLKHRENHRGKQSETSERTGRAADLQVRAVDAPSAARIGGSENEEQNAARQEGKERSLRSAFSAGFLTV
ncbi:hypothetical protein K438DRAFT_1779607 [Mycena galopus ATCC 62051]|nr:hypothetical protein K438DRAFT_1779607 [Mycena galopus ATCC 62051]